MRTYIKAKYGPPKVGEKRTAIKFAWLPKKIITFQGESDGKNLTNYYWIWLEEYKEDQEYIIGHVLSTHEDWGYDYFAWDLLKRYQ